MANKEQIIDRIKKLKKHAESAQQIGSLEEAEAFMKKVTELLTEYNISMFEVDSAEEKQGDPFKNWAYSESISFDDKHQGWHWKLKLMMVITEFNFTSFTYRQTAKTLKVYGNMENVDITVWLYHYLEIGLYNLSEKYYQEELQRKKLISKEEARHFSKVEAYRFKKSFLLGAVDGFKQQLREQRNAQSQKTMEIILYNNKALDTFLYKTNPYVRPGKAINTNINHSDAYDKGIETGKNFKVNKPVGNSSSQPQKKLQ